MLEIKKLFVCALVIALLAACGGSSSDSSTDDPTNTEDVASGGGTSDGDGSTDGGTAGGTTAAPGDILWQTGAPGQIRVTPALDQNGTIYFGIQGGGFFALNDENGSQVFGVGLTGSLLFSGPAVATDGTVYVGDAAALRALNPDGTEKWAFPVATEVASNVAVGSDGTIYFGEDSNIFYALRPDGTEQWRFSLNPGETIQAEAGPAIGADGAVYVPTNDGRLLAIDQTGALLWEISPQVNESLNVPSVGADGVVYLIDGFQSNTNVLAINPDGTLKWRVQLPFGIARFQTSRGSVVFGEDGTLYVASGDGTVRALDSAGNEIWSATGAGGAFPDFAASPVVGNNGVIYAVDISANVFAINPDGTRKWLVPLNGFTNTIADLAMTSNGTLIVADGDGVVTAIATDATGSAASAWPMAMQNAQRTARAAGTN